jgi:hypothetical protein
MWANWETKILGLDKGVEILWLHQKEVFTKKLCECHALHEFEIT